MHGIHVSIGMMLRHHLSMDIGVIDQVVHIVSILQSSSLEVVRSIIPLALGSTWFTNFGIAIHPTIFGRDQEAGKQVALALEDLLEAIFALTLEDFHERIDLCMLLGFTGLFVVGNVLLDFRLLGNTD